MTQDVLPKKLVPNETYHTVERLIEIFNKDLEIRERVKESTPKSNLTKIDTDALQQLSQ